MTIETRPARPANIVGSYSPQAVDWIAANIVTEAMIDLAVRRDTNYPCMKPYEELRRRERARRNIAIGIRAGTYAPFFS